MINPPVANATKRTRWNIDKMDKELFHCVLEEGLKGLPSIPSDVTPAEKARLRVDITMRAIRQACEMAIPKKGQRRGKKPLYWWNEEIATLKRECLKLRMILHRARRRDRSTEELREGYVKKKKLRLAVKRSKCRCWRALADDLNSNPWGLGYEIVMGKIGGTRTTPMGKKLVDKVVDGLFPNHVKRPAGNTTPEESEIPLFTQAELAAALRCLKKKKAPGPNGIPSEVLNVVAEKHQHALLDMNNACLKAGYFAPRWKEARLVLINKGKGQSDSPSIYRPLCMLDTAGKLLETLLRSRLQAATSAAGGLARRQHGFRRGRSTIDAVPEVVEAAGPGLCARRTMCQKRRKARSHEEAARVATGAVLPPLTSARRNI